MKLHRSSQYSFITRICLYLWLLAGTTHLSGVRNVSCSLSTPWAGSVSGGQLWLCLPGSRRQPGEMVLLSSLLIDFCSVFLRVDINCKF